MRAVLTTPDVEAGEVCLTCSDEGRPGEVLSVDDQGMAAVRTSGGVETVDTTIVAPVGTGDLVLIHAGTAIAVLDEPERERTSVSDFLYPFLEGVGPDVPALLDDLAASAQRQSGSQRRGCDPRPSSARRR